MGETIFYIIVMLLCLYGLTNLIWAVCLWFMGAKHSAKPFLVVPLGKTEDDIEATLRNALSRAELMGNGNCAGILAVDCGMDEASCAFCKEFCRRNTNILVCKLEELDLFMHRELSKKT